MWYGIGFGFDCLIYRGLGCGQLSTHSKLIELVGLLGRSSPKHEICHERFAAYGGGETHRKPGRLLVEADDRRVQGRQATQSSRAAACTVSKQGRARTSCTARCVADEDTDLVTAKRIFDHGTWLSMQEQHAAECLDKLFTSYGVAFDAFGGDRSAVLRELR